MASGRHEKGQKHRCWQCVRLQFLFRLPHGISRWPITQEVSIEAGGCATAGVPSLAARTTVSCTATISGTGYTVAKPVWTTYPCCTRTITTWSTKAVGRLSEQRKESCASGRLTDESCQRCLRARPAKTRWRSCTNGPKTAASTSALIRILRFGMARGLTTTGRWRRWCRGGRRKPGQRPDCLAQRGMVLRQSVELVELRV
jgi:hypothetical protein